MMYAVILVPVGSSACDPASPAMVPAMLPLSSAAPVVNDVIDGALIALLLTSFATRMVTAYCVSSSSDSSGCIVSCVLSDDHEKFTPAAGDGEREATIPDADMGSEKVTTTSAFVATLVLPFAGDTAATVGGVWSVAGAVVNSHGADMSLLPATSSASVTRSVYEVPGRSASLGVSSQTAGLTCTSE